MTGQAPAPGTDTEISARIYLQVMQLTNLVKVPPYNDPDFFGPILLTSIEVMDRMARARRERAVLNSLSSSPQVKASLADFVARVKECLDVTVKILVPCSGVGWKAVESYSDSGRAIIKALANPDVIAEMPHDRLAMLTDFIETERLKWVESFFASSIRVSEAEATESRLFDFCRDFIAFSLYLKAPVFMCLRQQTEAEAFKVWSTPESRFVKWRLEQR